MSAVPSRTGATSKASRLGRVGAVAVHQDDRVAVTQQGERRADRRGPCPARGPCSTRTPSRACGLGGAVGRVVVEDDDLRAGQRARNRAITVAIAGASLKQGIATAIGGEFIVRGWIRSRWNRHDSGWILP